MYFHATGFFIHLTLQDNIIIKFSLYAKVKHPFQTDFSSKPITALIYSSILESYIFFKRRLSDACINIKYASIRTTPIKTPNSKRTTPLPNPDSIINVSSI